AAVPMLHAAALDRRITKVVLEDMLVSWDAVETHRVHRKVFEQIVPSALKFYDLPDLAAAMAPRPVWLVDAANPLGQMLPATEVGAVYRGGQVQAMNRGRESGLPF